MQEPPTAAERAAIERLKQELDDSLLRIVRRGYGVAGVTVAKWRLVDVFEKKTYPPDYELLPEAERKAG